MIAYLAGYLKISIAIVGPGEKVKVHDEDAERAAEIAKETAAGSDIGSLCLTTPTMQKEWKFLVVKVHRAEGLPVMDGKVGASIVTVSKAKTVRDFRNFVEVFPVSFCRN
jgi:hypothetical protein